MNERETWYGLRNNNPKEVKSDINSLVTVVEKLGSNNLDMISKSHQACFESFNKPLNLIYASALHKQDNNSYPGGTLKVQMKSIIRA